MPNRIIKETICTSDSVDKLSWFEEVLFYRLIVSCDDFGRYDGRPAIIKNRLFPLKENLTVKAVADGIKKLANAELVILYTYEDKPYLYLPTWNDHQSIRAKKSKYPSPEDGVIASENICKQLQADASKCSRNPIRNPIQYECECESVKQKRFTPPTLEEVKSFIEENGYHVDPLKFIDYYTSNGWMVGKTKMKDWKAAVRNWERTQYATPQKGKKQFTTSEEYHSRPQSVISQEELLKRIESI